MKRASIAVLILLDLAFLGAVGYRLWQRYGELEAAARTAAVPAPPPPPAAETAPAVVPSTAAVAVSTGTAPAPTAPVTEPVAVSTATPAPPAPSPRRPTGPPRRIRFTYTNPAAAKVSLTGSFNNWTPEPFRKSANGQWSLVISIPPGDYAYNLVVDGKFIRDPHQRRSDDKGRSLLRVAPLNR